MKSIVKILITLIIITLFIVPAAAAGTQKEEVIYVNLNGDGSVSHVYAVNIFDMQTGGRITDYGSYASVRNMVTTDQINVNGDEITIDTNPGKLYYEGDLGSVPIPWDVDITYYMDGVPYSADEIAGKSGDLEMHIVIIKDPSDTEDFYEKYALMMTVTLDANKCSNITASGATMANVGSDKQLSYTLFPGKGADVVITSSVVDFGMDAISLNGIRLSLDVDLDTSDMEDDLTELSDGIVELDDGAWELRDGVENLSSGVGELLIGSDQLVSGARQLDSGAGSLSLGLTYIAVNNNNLMNGADQIFSGLLASANAHLSGSVSTLTKDNYASVLTSAISSTNDTTKQQQQLGQLLTQLTTYEWFYTNLSSYTTGVGYAAANASLLSNGASSLSSGASSLYEGAYELNSGTNDLKEGVANLTNGTGELRDNTTGLDTKLTDKINEVLDPIRGGTENTKSFVSEKNTEVSSVQFVMHTPEIKVLEEETTVEEKTENLNLMQRVMRLFGLA
ncbi:hypothetical protein [uncultured Methanocorpusculum sp.]|nr:hypothetical protein [uncultured Methanocorpusculum sp.]